MAGSAGLWSCTEETVVVITGSARINPMIVVDPTIISPDGSQIDISDAAPAESDMNFTLQADDGRYTHTWTSVGDYPKGELLRPGDYSAYATSGSPTSEGFDSPYFAGRTRLHLTEGTETDVVINAYLCSTLVHVTFDAQLTDRFASVGAMFHSDGYSYLRYASDETRNLFIHPGDISVSLDVTTADGQSACIEIASIPETAARTLYEVKLLSDGADEPTVTAQINGHDAGSVHITRELLTAPAPQITCSGFTSGTPLIIAEGNTSENEVIMNISNSPAAKLTLTSLASSLLQKGWPGQIDLASATPAELETLTRLGLELQRDAHGNITSVNLSKVIPALRTDATGNKSSFYLMATSANGKQSQSVTLSVNITPVEISVVNVSNILIGTNIGEIVLLSHSAALKENLGIEMLDSSGHWTPCTIDSIIPRGTNEYAVTYRTAATNAATAKVRIIYCGETVHEVEAKRVAPHYDVDVDAFAMTATLRISADDTTLTGLITELINVYVNGTQTFVGDRYPDEGLLSIGDLQPDKKYSITTSLVSDPTDNDLTTPVTIVTESTLQVRNSNFEDHDNGVKYNNMPCGGRYSQSIIDVFNCQNFTNFNFSQPRNWANTNAKTFCTGATRHNTWYMEPSVMSEVDNVEGYAAAKLQTVAWDTDGEPIPDYRQKPDQFLNYNPNVPMIKYRAAGKLFLGKYSFDPKTLTETYTEGIEFSSRPVAINGMYYFTPCAADITDRGKITVDIIGKSTGGMEISLASATGYLPPALSYTAFSIPLTYNIFGIKATKLKIMISSSMHTGSIEKESASIITSPDAKAANSIGGTLWIQDLSLSYK